MVTLDVDPQTTITAPRPMPDEVVILTCDANGARCWVTMTKATFGETTGLLAVLEEGTANLYQAGGKLPSPEWALAPATLAARDDAIAQSRQQARQSRMPARRARQARRVAKAEEGQYYGG
jgi:hypothetical protein